MAYVVTKTNGKIYTTLAEGILDNSLGISLLGQNYHNYGQLIANNFLHLLENQANDTPPVNPIAGQLWWNTKSSVLSYFDGDKFKNCSSSEIGFNPPIKPLDGDQWWDLNVHQLKVWTGDEWTVVGPQYPKGQQYTGILPITVTDNSSHNHIVAEVILNGVVMAIINHDPEFTLSTPIEGISHVSTGVTLTPVSKLEGTASNADRLGNVLAANYVRTTDSLVTLNGSLIVNGLSGVTIGQGLGLGLTINADTNGTQWIRTTNPVVTLAAGASELSLSTSGTITVSNEPSIPKSITTKGYVDTLVSTTDIAMKGYVDGKFTGIINGSPLDTLKKLSDAINNDPSYWINANANMAFKANIASPTLTGQPRAPTPVSGENSTIIATTEYVKDLLEHITHVGTLVNLNMGGPIVPVLDNVYDIGTAALRWKNIYGTAVSTRYGDLAENYTTDAEYKPGTVVCFGGEEEVTSSSQYSDSRIAGVVSTNPGYLMNDQVTTGVVAVALTGKVPCLVHGPIHKGDILVNSAFEGVATKLLGQEHWSPGCVIGKSLEDNAETGIRLVMVSVGRF